MDVLVEKDIFEADATQTQAFAFEEKDKNTLHKADAASMEVKDHYALNLYASVYCLCSHISRLTRVGGKSIEQYFKQYPFLKEYFVQANRVMPGQLSWQAGSAWWCENICEMEEGSETHLPLKALRQGLALSFYSKMALMLAGLVEEDSRFGTLYSELQQPLSYRRPMLETLGNIASGGDSSQNQNPWDICSPLVSSGLITVENMQVPRSEWILTVNSQVWDLIRGNNGGEENRPWYFKSVEELLTIDDLVVDAKLRYKIEGVAHLFISRRVNTMVMRAQEGAHSADIIGAVARRLEKNIIVVDAQNSNDSTSKANIIDDAFGILCTILNAVPIFIFNLAPGETTGIPKLKGYTGPVGVVLGEEGGLDSDNPEQVVTLTLQSLDPLQRKMLWQYYLSSYIPGYEFEDLDKIARQFRLPGDYIRQVYKLSVNNASLEQRQVITMEDVRSSSRQLNRQKLDTLADPLEAKGSWSHLISVDTTAEKLGELQQRCSYREQLLNHLGPAFKNSSNCGVRALFTGRSGTGKTLAAKILAAEVGMDIYRVDLASIVNKYIGETEKNLHQVLTRAEALDVILLLDEGDSLLGARTDVKSANDRYANLETNYLLQRLEHYKGVILVTTNLSDNIDKGFQRRMDIVVPFFQPQMEQRLAIFNLHLPHDHTVDDMYLEKAAKYCTLMGGQIRNVCLHASLMALEEKSVLGAHQLEVALRSEYRKNGGTFPLDVSMQRPESDGGMGCFVNALSQSRQNW